MINFAHFKQKLIEQRKLLLETQSISQQSTKTVELDQTRLGRLSRMDAMQQQEMAKAVALRRSKNLQRISVALQRIDNEDYGYCLACDNKIAAGRLEFDPCASLCITCAEAKS